MRKTLTLTVEVQKELIHGFAVYFVEHHKTRIGPYTMKRHAEAVAVDLTGRWYRATEEWKAQHMAREAPR